MLLQIQPLEQLPPVPANAPANTPVELRAMIQHVFGSQINELSTEELSSRAILAATVKQIISSLLP